MAHYGKIAAKRKGQGGMTAAGADDSGDKMPEKGTGWRKFRPGTAMIAVVIVCAVMCAATIGLVLQLPLIDGQFKTAGHAQMTADYITAKGETWHQARIEAVAFACPVRAVALNKVDASGYMDAFDWKALHALAAREAATYL
jgi:hypothetical protein